VLHTVAFPPYDIPEAVWAFAVPVAMWCLRRPRWTEYLVVTGGASFVSWLILLEWLRTLTRDAGWVALLGWVALAAVMALFPLAWFAAARAMLPRTMDRSVLLKLVVVLGLAGLWIVLEWLRSWIFTGFPFRPASGSDP
jgi:apolipoprotein N-acyltransferase